MTRKKPDPVREVMLIATIAVVTPLLLAALVLIAPWVIGVVIDLAAWR